MEVDYYRPAQLTQSIVLSRLAAGPTLLPSTVAAYISSISLLARISVRSASLFIEQIIESIRLGTLVGLGLTRRALIAAVGSARTLHNIFRGLDFAGRDEHGRVVSSAGNFYLSALDQYTSAGVYVITHAFTLAELFTMAGLSLTTTVTSLGFTAAEESVRLLDGLLGSGESSRALAAIIALVRKELFQDPAFQHSSVISTLSVLTKTLTCFVCLQASTSRRSAKEMKMRVIYDCTVIEGQSNVQDEAQEVEQERQRVSAELYHRRSRAPSVDLLVPNTWSAHESPEGLTPRAGRSRQTSVSLDVMEEDGGEQEESAEIVQRLTALCGDDSMNGGHELPEEVEQALRELHEGAVDERAVSSGLGIYELEMSQTTTTTTTIVRTSQKDGDEEDEGWVELGCEDGDKVAEADEDDVEIPSAVKVVLRTMTQKITKTSRSIRRVGKSSPPQLAPFLLHSTAGSPAPTSNATQTTPNALKRGAMPEWTHDSSEVAADNSPRTSPTREKGKGVFRALGKALKKTNAMDSFISGRSSRGASRPTSRDSTPPATPASLADLSPPSSPRLTLATPPSRAHSRQASSSSAVSHHCRSALAAEPLTPITPSASHSPTAPPNLRHASSIQSMRSSIVTTCKHTASTPTEESDPKFGNFPRRPPVANLQAFMRYSSAAYGQAFMRLMRLGKDRGMGDFTFPNTARTPANNHAFAHHVGISVDDILLDTYNDNGTGSDKLQPVIAYVAVDHSASAIVLSLRGSLGLHDLLVDLTCDYETIHVRDGTPGDHYYVHAGMWHSATKMQRGLVHNTIREAMLKYPTYGVVLCGHSLGGGVAALLSVLWASPTSSFERDLPLATYSSRASSHPPLFTPFVTSIASGLPAGRPIACYAYGPPCVASVDLQRYCRGLVTSVVSDKDVIPTLSLGTLRDLKTMAINLHEDGQSGTCTEIIGRVVGLAQGRVAANRNAGALAASESLVDVGPEARQIKLSSAEIAAGRGSNKALDPAYRDPSLTQPELSEELAVNDYLWSVLRTLRASNVNDKLYPPGDNFVVESYTVFIASESGIGQYSRREGSRILLRAVDDVEKRFGEPIFGKSLFLDHSPCGYEKNLDLLAKAVLG